MKHACVRLLTVLPLLSLLVGCGVNPGPRPTPEPIFVTATPFVPPTGTPTPAETPVVNLTFLPTATAPFALTSTPTRTPSRAITLTPTFTPTFTDTPAPRTSRGGASCSAAPQGGFGLIYQQDASVRAALGCPTSPAAGIPPAAASVSNAYQPFENGFMLWSSALGWQPQSVIYVVFNDGTYQRFPDTFQDGVDPTSAGESPPPGRLEPIRGFGKVWRQNPPVRAAIGWATAPESGSQAALQLFERGEMVWALQLGQTLVFVSGAPGSWRSNGTPF